MWLVSLRLMYYLGLLFGDCIFLSLHTYLQLHSTCTIQWFAVFASGQWSAACALSFCTFPRIAFCSYLSLTQSVFVSAYLYQPVCHKFRICIFIQFNFINLFNVFFFVNFCIIAIRNAIHCIILLFVTLWSVAVTSNSTKLIIWRIQHIW